SITCCGKRKRSIPNASGTARPASRRPSSRSLRSSDPVAPREHAAFWRHELGRPMVTKNSGGFEFLRSAYLGTPSAGLFIAGCTPAEPTPLYPAMMYRYRRAKEIRKLSFTEEHDGNDLKPMAGPCDQCGA